MRRVSLTLIEVVVSLMLLGLACATLSWGISRARRATDLSVSRSRVARVCEEGFRLSAITKDRIRAVFRREEGGGWLAYVDMGTSAHKMQQLPGIQRVAVDGREVSSVRIAFCNSQGLVAVEAEGVVLFRRHYRDSANAVTCPHLLLEAGNQAFEVPLSTYVRVPRMYRPFPYET